MPHSGSESIAQVAVFIILAAALTLGVWAASFYRRRNLWVKATQRYTRGITMIMAERVRQFTQEGYSLDHDAHHTDGSLLIQAVALCVKGTGISIGHEDYGIDDDVDPWGLAAKHGHDPVRSLVIAGALIAAEIDRLLAFSDSKTT